MTVCTHSMRAHARVRVFICQGMSGRCVESHCGLHHLKHAWCMLLKVYNHHNISVGEQQSVDAHDIDCRTIKQDFPAFLTSRMLRTRRINI